MSFMTPILTTPSEYCAWAPAHPSAKATAVKLASLFIAILPTDPVFVLGDRHSPLHTEIVVELFNIGVQFRAGHSVDDAPMFHDVVAIRNRRGEAEVLLHQENGEALLFQRADGMADLLDDDGSKS